MKEASNRLLATIDPEAFMQWQILLEHQVSSYWPYELDFLLTSDLWINSTNVLDVGCGNGYYLSYLQRYFPGKRFHGIDISAEHIKAAKSNPQLKNVELTNSGLSDYQPAEPFDAVVMRLVIQHLDYLKGTLATARRLIKPNGVIIIIEPDPSRLMNFPPTPKFYQLLVDYSSSPAVATKTRATLNDLGDQLRNLSDWEVHQCSTYVAPSIGPFSSSSLLQIFLLWIDIFEKSESVESDFDSVREEINAWAESDKSFNRMGLQIYSLRATS